MKVILHKVFVCTTALTAVLLCTPHSLCAQTPKQGISTIVIDPGHGGQDSGCVWGTVREKDIVLDVALLLGSMIKENMPGVKVVYTRDKDIFVDLYKRGELANKVGADLFFSIHVNSSALKKGQTPPAGTETFVLGPTRTDANLESIQRENDVIKLEKDYEKNYAGFQPGSPESFVMSSLQQYANSDQSITLSQIIQQQYIKNTSMPSRGVKQGGLVVLWKTTMPSVLTEIGFINNEKERKLITSDAGQKKIATSLFNSISQYKAKVEGNSNPVLLAGSSGFGDEAEEIAGEPAPAAPAKSSQTEQAKPSGTVKQTAGQPSKWEFSGSAVVYRVQIYSVPRKLSLNSKELRPFAHNITERKVGNTYKYYVGSCTTHDEASKLHKEVCKTVKDAFMVAFDGEKQITVSEARKLTR